MSEGQVFLRRPRWQINPKAPLIAMVITGLGLLVPQVREITAFLFILSVACAFALIVFPKSPTSITVFDDHIVVAFSSEKPLRINATDKISIVGWDDFTAYSIDNAFAL